MKKYNKYKKSGVEWLGMVPDYWKIERVKNFLADTNTVSTTGNEELLTVSHITGVTRRSEKNVNMFLAETNVGYKKCCSDDLILNTMWAWMGALGTCKDPGICSPAYNVYRPLPRIEYYGQYFDYLFRTPNFIVEMTRYSKGIVSSRLRLYPREFYQIQSIVPPIEEQITIANYLDSKTQLIDKKIELLNKKIDSYKELRKSLINRVVCRGLDKNVELKDSGIDWIGKIPQHWLSHRLKDIGFLYSGLSGKSGNDFYQEDNPQNKSFIPYTNIFNNSFIQKELMGSVVVFEKENQNKVKLNDIFFLMSSEDYEGLGKSSLLKEDLKDTYLNSFCKGFRIKKQCILPEFVNYQLSSFSFKNLLQVEGKGFTRINLKSEKINEFNIFVPDTIQEQKEIVKYINDKANRIDSIITNIQQQIEKLQELRKTLINDVVTGKIKVTE